MQANQTPRRLPLPFAANGLKNDIPEDSQGTTSPGAATLNDGFPRATMLPPSSGGVPPSGKDFNGILNLLAQTVRWVQAGGSFIYDSDFAKDPNVGGYPKNAVLLRADGQGFWMSTADNNTTDPDATDGSARNWISTNPDWSATSGPGAILNKPNGFLPVGTAVPYFGVGVPDGFLLANGAALSRTTFAALFAVLGTTYGAPDANSFNLPDTRGLVLRGFDNGRGLDPGRVLGSYQSDSFAWHGHGVNDPGHGHNVYDPGHNHGLHDPGHSHGIKGAPTQINPSGPSNVDGHFQTAIYHNTEVAGTGLWMDAAGSGIGIYGNGTGISIQANGGSETRGKNLAVNYIIKY